MTGVAIIGYISSVQELSSVWMDLNPLFPSLLVVSEDGVSQPILNQLNEVFKCSAKLVPKNDDMVVKILFELKMYVDQDKINEVVIFYDPSMENQVTDVYNTLFRPSYNAKLLQQQFLQNAQEILPNHLCTSERVQKFLSTCNSYNGKDVLIFKSKVIPNMFSHGYSARHGGLSSYPDQSSLNLCYSDRKKDSLLVVMENRARLASAARFDAKRFFVAKAVHGKNVWVYEKSPPESYDAIVTNTRHVTVAAPGADCNMVLFADPVAKACGAAHAGWKGILNGIVKSTVQAMIENYGSDPKNIKVCIGPSLNVCCCEFGIDGVDKFSPIHNDCIVWREGSAKPYVNLRLAVRVLLENEGIQSQNVEDGSNYKSELQICTKCDSGKRFFSYRRDGSQFGNQVGFIGLL